MRAKYQVNPASLMRVDYDLNLSHKQAYKDVGVVTVIIPVITTLIAIIAAMII